LNQNINFMKKIAFLTFLSGLSFCVNAQDYNDKQNMEVKTTQEAHYPEGEDVLYKYIFDNVNYSDEAKAAYIEGNVMVSFNVQADSSVTNTFVISGIGYGIDEEVVRLLKELKFAPSIRNGLKVKMNLVYTFPVVAH